MTSPPYDKTKPESIEKYGQGMIGKTFRDIFEEHEAHLIKEPVDIATTYGEEYAKKHARKSYKGGVGNLVEECYFNYSANSNSDADFSDAGVELKVTPYKKDAKGNLRAKERLILTMINYIDIVKEKSFEESHVWKKCHLMLLVWYLYEKNKNNLDFQVNFVKLFSPPPEDQKIMKEDYNKILTKIRNGKAHELSESDTLYLGAVTKGATSKDRRAQPFSSIPAKPRAFSLKNSYMTYVLNHFFVPNIPTYESISHGQIKGDFEKYIEDSIAKYKGWSVQDLCSKFNLNAKAKNLESMIAFRILGIKGNKAEEFEKANVKVKAIRINKKGTIRENMSFPSFKFKELVQETWEDSAFGNYLRETRFLFVIYHEREDGQYYLSGCQFWNIPCEDLEGDVRTVWERTKKVIQDGLKITVKNGIHYTNLPKQSENRVAHVRPHARNAQDTYELPDGRKYPKQCFWLNRTYILSQINENLRK